MVRFLTKIAKNCKNSPNFANIDPNRFFPSQVNTLYYLFFTADFEYDNYRFIKELLCIDFYQNMLTGKKTGFIFKTYKSHN